MTDYDGWDQQEDSDWPQEEPDWRQDNPDWLQDNPDWLQDNPDWLQDDPFGGEGLPPDEPAPDPEDAASVPFAAEAAEEPLAAAEPVPDEAADVFPPMVDVGELPEPVDGFPWIDTGSLGVVDPAAMAAAPDGAPDPQELAEYAATDLPPGQDPWAALADSDDPATAALARFYAPGEEG